jgi:hypothetical protein
MVEEHANVPPRYPRDRRTDAGTDAGNFGKFRYGERGHLSPDDLARMGKSVTTAPGM